VVIESLTKFASGTGDVMMGATILNKESCFYDLFQESVKSYTVNPDG
jgi:cystathionine beta-lyase/cystathionine gamma-synthase